MTDNTERREPRSYLIPAREVALFVRDSLSAGKKDSAVRWLTEAVARLIASQRQDFQPIYLLSPKQRVTTSSTLCWPQRSFTRRTSAASRRGLGCMQNG